MKVANTTHRPDGHGQNVIVGNANGPFRLIDSNVNLNLSNPNETAYGKILSFRLGEVRVEHSHAHNGKHYRVDAINRNNNPLDFVDTMVHISTARYSLNGISDAILDRAEINHRGQHEFNLSTHLAGTVATTAVSIAAGAAAAKALPATPFIGAATTATLSTTEIAASILPAYRDAQRVQQTISSFADDVRFGNMLISLDFEIIAVTQLTDNLSGNSIRLANSFESQPFPTVHTPASLDTLARLIGSNGITVENALGDIGGVYRDFRSLSSSGRTAVYNAQRQEVDANE